MGSQSSKARRASAFGLCIAIRSILTMLLPTENSFKHALAEAYRQTPVENAKAVVLGTYRYTVRRTSEPGLQQVDFTIDGIEIRSHEQNPATKSR